jgi:hypothetical protein
MAGFASERRRYRGDFRKYLNKMGYFGFSAGAGFAVLRGVEPKPVTGDD